MERVKKEAIREKLHRLKGKGIPKTDYVVRTSAWFRSKNQGTRVMEMLAKQAVPKRKERGLERRKHKEGNHKRKERSHREEWREQ